METVIIYKNISDVIEIKEGKYGLGLYQKLKLIASAKKNPILLTILTENFISFTSTTIPIFSPAVVLRLPAPHLGDRGQLRHRTDPGVDSSATADSASASRRSRAWWMDYDSTERWTRCSSTTVEMANLGEIVNRQGT